MAKPLASSSIDVIHVPSDFADHVIEKTVHFFSGPGIGEVAVRNLIQFDLLLLLAFAAIGPETEIVKIVHWASRHLGQKSGWYGLSSRVMGMPRPQPWQTGRRKSCWCRSEAT